jgi:hypothetical protein
VLADFQAEWTDTQLPLVQIKIELWTMYFDGLLMKTGAGVGLLFISPLGIHLAGESRQATVVVAQVNQPSCHPLFDEMSWAEM